VVCHNTILRRCSSQVSRSRLVSILALEICFRRSTLGSVLVFVLLEFFFSSLNWIRRKPNIEALLYIYIKGGGGLNERRAIRLRVLKAGLGGLETKMKSPSA